MAGLRERTALRKPSSSGLLLLLLVVVMLVVLAVVTAAAAAAVVVVLCTGSSFTVCASRIVLSSSLSLCHYLRLCLCSHQLCR
eukprot:COSAG06_NODE_2308_length_7109_cov_7.230385_1_plen_83_part_00